jgi:alpha-glucosidase (family GH31 glycosyl hydrolase)
MARARLVAAASVSLLAASACAPSPVHTTIAGVDVVVDHDHIALARGGRVLWQTSAKQIGFKKVDATFDMQFGMFDIEDESAPYAGAAYLAPHSPGVGVALDGQPRTDVVIFDVANAQGTIIANGRVSPIGEGVEIRVDAVNGDDAVQVASACTFHHAIGLGAQTHDVDHHGHVVPLWVSEQGVGTTDDDNLPTVWQLVGRRHTSYAPIPAFVADNAAAYVVDTTAFARFDLCATHENVASLEAWSPTWKLDIYASDSPKEAQAKMVDALGRPPVPPPWTFAPWNDAIFGSQNVRDVAAKIRANGLPSSVLWTEDWRGGADNGSGTYRLDEDWNPDPVMYPDFAQMVKDVNALGFNELVYFNTFAVTGADIFDDVTSKGFAIQATDQTKAGPNNAFMFTGPDRNFSPTTLVDLTNPDARDFVKKHLTDAFALGVRGWMADFGEWLPLDGVKLHDGEDPHLAHNQYPSAWHQLNREAQQDAHVLDDSVIFERSAWLHSQSEVQVIWAGDQRTDFESDDGLPTVMPIGIGLSAVGFPFVTHDIAGYQSATNPSGDQELFFRWTELGAFTPIMRTHHGTTPTLNVNIFTNADTIAHWKRYATLHMQLYPYLRKLALDACAKSGAPLWTPLPLAFPDDDVWDLKDEVMLGPALLIAPVVNAGETSRTVRFPSARFAPFSPAYVPASTSAAAGAVVGPKDVDADAAVSDIPVFIVAGGIVPMTATAADTLLPGVGGLHGIESVEGDRVVVVGLGAAGSFTEESGAAYTLTGKGTARPSSTEPDGAVVVVGNGVVNGDGLTFTLAHQPATRTTRVIFE